MFYMWESKNSHMIQLNLSFLYLCLYRNDYLRSQGRDHRGTIGSHILLYFLINLSAIGV